MARNSPNWSNSAPAILAAVVFLIGTLAETGAQGQNQAQTGNTTVAPSPSPRLPRNKLPGSGGSSRSTAKSSEIGPKGVPRNRIEVRPKPPAPVQGTGKGSATAKRALPANVLPRPSGPKLGEVLSHKNPFTGDVRPDPPQPHRAAAHRTGRDPHAGWFHGNWNGNLGSNHRWDWAGLATKAEAAGLTGWKVGSAVYRWGYAPYLNPYCRKTDAAGASGFDYTQPLDTERPIPEPGVLDPAIAVLDDARAAFWAGDYSKALTLTDQVLKTLPGDVAVHELRALALFALKRYDDAAATLYAVLSMGPGWDWTTQIGLYAKAETYTEQLRALEDNRDDQPDSAGAHFVLAYHYLTAGHADSAAEELRDVERLKSDDRLSGHLLALIAPRDPGKKDEDPDRQRGPTVPLPPAAEPMKPQRAIASVAPVKVPEMKTKPEPQPLVASVAPVKVPEMKTKPAPQPQPSVDKASAAPAKVPETKAKPQPPAMAEFAGTWKASPGKGLTIDLAIRPDKTFSWTVTGGQATGRPHNGAFTYGGETLALVQENGTPLVGWLVWQDSNHFRFRIAGTSPQHPGLEFSR